jgi:glycogen operon protein
MLQQGRPRRWVHGADGGVNFAVLSTHATAIELCLFTPMAGAQRQALPGRQPTSGTASRRRRGLVYGWWHKAPERGHRFNPNKLLLDPGP